MGSGDSDIVRQAEAILASAKSFEGDRSKRLGLMKQIDMLYQDLEDPMDAVRSDRSSHATRQVANIRTSDAKAVVECRFT